MFRYNLPFYSFPLLIVIIIIIMCKGKSALCAYSSGKNQLAIPVVKPVTFNACPSGLISIFVILHFSDINECTKGIHDCSKNASCVNTAGSFNCTCNLGLTGDGRSCLGTFCRSIHFSRLLS